MISTRTGSRVEFVRMQFYTNLSGPMNLKVIADNLCPD